jgi:CO/xanthine dehydrogenase FAD-binding subunit
MTRHRTVERDSDVARLAPLVSATLPYVAHPAIRTRGTIGGSLAHADPAAELPAVMLALNASLTVRNGNAVREVAAAEFFTGLFTTTIEPGELLTEIAIPERPDGSRFAFDEISRRHGDYALAGVAAAVTLDANGRCTDARVALFSVGDRPVLSEQVSRSLVGQQPSADAIRAAAEDAAQRDIDPPGDIHASSRYRRQLTAVLVRRVLHRAIDGGVERAARTGTGGEA